MIWQKCRFQCATPEKKSRTPLILPKLGKYTPKMLGPKKILTGPRGPLGPNPTSRFQIKKKSGLIFVFRPGIEIIFEFEKGRCLIIVLIRAKPKQNL